MATSSKHGVPISGMEEAICHLDGPEEPWSVHVEARVRGGLDADRLRTAVMAALVRHPRARARMVRGRRWRRLRHWSIDSWPAVDPLTVVPCDDDEDLDTARANFESVAVPLCTSPPLRVLLAHHPQGDVIMLNVHHAACDGIGALQLLRDIAAAYVDGSDSTCRHGQLASDAPTLGALPPVPPMRRLRNVLGELRHSVSYSSHLAPEGGDERSGYGFCQLALTAEATEVLLASRSPTVTVNDALVAALHLSSALWNAEHGVKSSRISVLMPVNLRPRDRWYDGVGNLACMVAIATTARDRSSPAAVAEAVSRRSAHVKHNATAALSAVALAKLQVLPEPIKRGMARLVSRRRFVPTALLSNLGSLPSALHFGGEEGQVTHLWFSPPAKMPLGLALGALTVQGKLHLCFRYRHPLFGAEAAARFATRYVDALYAVVGAGGETTASDTSRRTIDRARNRRSPHRLAHPTETHPGAHRRRRDGHTPRRLDGLHRPRSRQ